MRLGSIWEEQIKGCTGRCAHTAAQILGGLYQVDDEEVLP